MATYVTRRIQYSFAYVRQHFADKAPSEATFRGSEFLSYDLGQTGGEPIVSAQDAISLYFRTRQPNGLLFYTSECDSYKPSFVSNQCSRMFEKCGDHKQMLSLNLRS